MMLLVCSWCSMNADVVVIECSQVGVRGMNFDPSSQFHEEEIKAHLIMKQWLFGLSAVAVKETGQYEAL